MGVRRVIPPWYGARGSVSGGLGKELTISPFVWMQTRAYNSYNYMANKSKKVQFHKDIKRRRIRKSLSERIKRLSKRESHYRTCEDEAIDPPMLLNTQLVKVEPKTKVFVKKGVFNYVQSLASRVSHKVNFLFYGMIYIDEEALKSEEQDRSLLKSMFKFYSINSVKVTGDFLVLKIQKNYENTFPVEYVIDRFRNEGKREYYEMAEMIERINVRMGHFQGMKAPSLFDHQIDKYLKKIEGKLCVIMISPNIIVFTKELLQLSGFSMDSIASSCLANRSFLFDLFLSNSYVSEVHSMLSKFDLGRRLRTGEITPEEYRESSSCSSYSSIIDKNNNKIHIKSRRYNMDIGVACWEVEQIIGKEKLIDYQKFAEDKQRINYEELQLRKGEREVKRLTAVLQSKTPIQEASSRTTCGYKSILDVKLENL